MRTEVYRLKCCDTDPLGDHVSSISVPLFTSLVSCLLGSGQVSVLSQAISCVSHSHQLEFTVKSTEEQNVVMEELKACDSGTTLVQSVTRSCICHIAQYMYARIKERIKAEYLDFNKVMCEPFKVLYLWHNCGPVPKHRISFTMGSFHSRTILLQHEINLQKPETFTVCWKLQYLKLVT